VRILVVTDHLPGHDLGFQKSGHAQYLGSILEHFAARGDDVTAIVFRPQVDFVTLPAHRLSYRVIGPSFARAGTALFVRSPAAIRQWLAWNVFGRLPQRWQAAVDALRRRVRRARGAVHHLGSFLTIEEKSYVCASVRDLQPDLIVYDGIFNSCGRVGDCEHWLIAHEIKHQRAASFAGQGVDVAASAVSAEREAAILAEIDAAIAIQRDDEREIKRLAPDTRVVVVPATMDVAPRSSAFEAIPGRCVFVGSGSFHNYDGIAWFLAECWPQIRAAAPAATLDIFGSVCFRLSDVPAGVTLHGIVDDLAPAYAAAAITIVPLRIGSGLKVKLIEAFAHAQAVVTTPVGAQGLLDLAPQPFELAESSADFAAATIALLAAPARQGELRAAAVRCAQAFTPAEAFAQLDAALAGPATVYA
jgi:glycosyltransferase involved in cell wall biosynthesis